MNEPFSCHCIKTFNRKVHSGPWFQSIIAGEAGWNISAHGSKTRGKGCSHHGGLEGRKQKGVRGSHNLQKHASKDPPPPVKPYLLKFHSLPKLCHQQGNRYSTCKPRVDNGISTQNPQSCGIWSMIRTRVMDPAVKRHREREQRHTHYSVSQNPEQGPSCLCLGWHCLALQ